METIRLRLTGLREALESSLWLYPGIGVALGIIAAFWLGQLGDLGTNLPFVFAGSADSARSVLSTIAGSTITVTSLTFSLTVVALQVASGQFTPRLMRSFLSDRGNQTVLAIFLGTFAYALVLLQGVQAESDRITRSIPALGVTVATGAALASVVALVYFFHHLTVQLRVDKVMQQVAHDTIEEVRTTFRPAIVDDTPPTMPDVPDDAISVHAPTSGYLANVALETLVDNAGRAGLSVRLRPPLGSWVVKDTTIAWTWPSNDEPDLRRDDLGDQAQVPDDATEDERARHLVLSSIYVASSRTLDADASFGIRQLVDIAIRALSPGINDPTTAVEAVRQMSRVMVVLGSHDLGTIRRTAGAGIVVVPRPDFREHLHLAVDQVLRYGAGEPAVLRALAVMLRDVAEVCDGSNRIEAVLDDAALVAQALQRADLPAISTAEVQEVLSTIAPTAQGHVTPTPPRAV
ncbi:MAG TPA: DUF2254 domain-containing protein [Nitriliruptoraceae bacterium]|nr:DUF2254 domain-containing protein [Nitriliruptoraceae bacterium]